MQDINKEIERERAIANTRDLFRGSSTLTLRPRLLKGTRNKSLVITTLWSPKTISLQHSYRMNMSMNCSSVCVRKQGKRWWRKTQRISFNTLDKTPFWLEVLALNLVEKTLLKKWEKLAQKQSPNLVENNAQNPKFIGCKKLAVGVCQACRSTAWSTGQRSYFRPLCHRSTGRSTEPGYRE